MDWFAILIFAAVLAGFFLLRRASLISVRAAREYLKQGAVIVDVRSPEEFASGHLLSAVNIPVDDLESELPRRVHDRGRVVLLHCEGGMRSGIAKRKLRAMGYLNVFNLGSHARAALIVGHK